ncbi:ABC transporter permease [Microbispora sp. RL4-1S]|uniref:ABC transporter permease n=1 Tax=Microbispora oryzae TaxID=2806554 RepID=A0A941AS63_9ACTN|nr:ABC transporter permease [Microbispora oryzae]
MRTVFLASLRIHIRRYVAAAIAVAVAVAFVVVVGVLTSGAYSGLMDGLGAPYRDADHVVSAAGWPSSELDPKAAIAFTERHGENAAATGRATLPVRAGGGRLSEATVGPIATLEEWRWQELSSGRFPARTGEAVVDVYFALAANIAVGDRLRIGEGAAARDVGVVGLVESPSPPAQASMYVTWPQLLQWRDHLHLTAVAVRGEVGQLPAGAKAQSPEGFAAERLTYVQNRVDSLSVMLLLFAGIALFVSVLVIANTFSILFAQRLRDFALLRCIGATRRQVVRSVRREAAVVGVLASLTGTLAGIGVGYGLIALISALSPTVPMGAAELPMLWLLGGVRRRPGGHHGRVLVADPACDPGEPAGGAAPGCRGRPAHRHRRGAAGARCDPPGRRAGPARGGDAPGQYGVDGGSRRIGVHRRTPLRAGARSPPGPDHRRAARPRRAAGDQERCAQSAADRHHHCLTAGRRHPDDRRAHRDGHVAFGVGRADRQGAPHRCRAHLARGAGHH